jgi:hypothetical protein
MRHTEGRDASEALDVTGSVTVVTETLDTVHRVKLKYLQSVVGWICLSLQVGEQIGTALSNKPVSVGSSRSTFHLKMEADAAS